MIPHDYPLSLKNVQMRRLRIDWRHKSIVRTEDALAQGPETYREHRLDTDSASDKKTVTRL